MENEEEKKEPEDEDIGDSEMKGDDDDEEWGDGEGWDDDEGWGDEEEVDPVVAEALAAAKKKRELDEKISEVRISFRPPGYHEGMVARIVGDFTDWVPFTMQMHPMDQIVKNPALRDEFFVEVKLVKGFRYRYIFEVNNIEMIDEKDPNKGMSSQGQMTNYVDIAGDGS